MTSTTATPSPPTWGRVTDEGRTAPVLRFVLADRTVSFPYHCLVRWELSVGDTETLTVHATPQATVTVRGRTLAPLRDALDSCRLEQVRAQGDRAALRAGPNDTWIQGITVETS